MSGMRQGIEAELLLWKATYDGDTGGRLIFEVSKEEVEPFFGLRTKKGGQRFAAVLVLIDDDESAQAPTPPVQPEIILDPKLVKVAIKELKDEAGAPRLVKPRPPATEAQREAMNGLCGLAIKWCDDEHFQEWCAFTFPREWGVSKEKKHEKIAADVIYHVCNVASRKHLDETPRAADEFREKIVAPYKLAREADGKE